MAACLPVKIVRKSESESPSSSSVSKDCLLDWPLGHDLYTATSHTSYFLPGNTFVFPTMSSQVSVMRKDAFGSMAKTNWKLSYGLIWFHTQKTHVVKIQIDRAPSTSPIAFQGEATLTASVQKETVLIPSDWVERYIQDIFMNNLERRTESFPIESSKTHDTTMGWELHFPTTFGLEPLSPESMSSIVLKMEFQVSLLKPQGETTMELLADLDLTGATREDMLAKLLEEERTRVDRLENTVIDLRQRIVDLEQGNPAVLNGGGYSVQSTGYKCGYCSALMPSYEVLQVHEAKVRLGNGYFLCCYCPKQFVSKKTLKAHQPEHHEELKHACALCGRKYYRVAKLKEHCRKMHDGVGWRKEDMDEDEDSSDITILDIIGDI